MESPGDWTASALFSPSKARAHQAQAKDWNVVEAWLSKKYGTRVPTFEKNEETLQALLKLANANEAADEQQSLIERVQKAALQANARRERVNDDVYHELLGNLTDEGRESLTALATSVVLLDSDDVVAASENLCELTSDRFELSEQVNRADAQLAALQREKARLERLQDELKDDNFKTPSDLSEKTSEWTRSTKHLKAKLAEYDERLAALRSVPVPSRSIESVAQQGRDVKALQEQLDVVNTELAAFQDLPVDPKAARVKLEAARTELRRLVDRRDELFGNMAGD